MNYSITPVLRADKINLRGEAPVCMRITVDRKSRYKTLFKIEPHFWNEKTKTVKKSCPNYAAKNAVITKEKDKYERELLRITMDDGDSSCLALMKGDVRGKKSLDFFKYADEYLQNLQESGKYATYKRYKTPVTKFRNYLKRETLPVSSINLDMINRYEHYLRTELHNKTNTVGSNMKIISKFMNDIYREYEFNPNKNPFTKYKIKIEKTERVRLTERELKRIENLKPVPVSKLYDPYQIFLFENYTGIRIGDILTLKWKNLHHNTLKFRMSKTGKQMEIPLIEKAQKIVEIKKRTALRFSDKLDPEKYIFNILREDIEKMTPQQKLNSISSATAVINKQLKVIAVKARIAKNISTHVGRHSFATMLMTKGANIFAVKELLGHDDVRVTQIYAKLIDSKKREAIELLNN